jgi:hypothetical protein
MSFDLALIDGRIWTEDPGQPESEAVGITRNRIEEVSSTDEVLKQCSNKTRVVELDVVSCRDSTTHMFTSILGALPWKAFNYVMQTAWMSFASESRLSQVPGGKANGYFRDHGIRKDGPPVPCPIAI